MGLLFNVYGSIKPYTYTSELKHGKIVRIKTALGDLDIKMGDMDEDKNLKLTTNMPMSPANGWSLNLNEYYQDFTVSPSKPLTIATPTLDYNIFVNITLVEVK